MRWQAVIGVDGGDRAVIQRSQQPALMVDQ